MGVRVPGVVYMAVCVFSVTVSTMIMILFVMGFTGVWVVMIWMVGATGCGEKWASGIGKEILVSVVVSTILWSW
jgi:hypothetical protein